MYVCRLISWLRSTIDEARLISRSQGLPDDFFDASAYSFFGTTGDDVGGLEGELEVSG